MDRICEYDFLLIDDVDLFDQKNVCRKVNSADKHPEPVVRMDALWDGPTDAMNYVNVLYDEQEQLFKMWYSVLRTGGSYSLGLASRRLAYATSLDGIHWERPILNRVEHNGSTKNNYILPELGAMIPTIIIDPSDSPDRRYKMIFGTEDAGWENFHVPLSLAYSHDGIDWKRPAHVNPVMRGLSDGGWGLVYDVDRRKYVLFTRRTPNLPRDISQYESGDLVNWEDRGRILVPGDAHDPPDLFNFQMMRGFFYGPFCLGALQVHYSLPGAESFEVHNKPPADFPNRRMGQTNLQLAFSRNMRQWHRPGDRAAIVQNGPDGSPDGGNMFPANNPIVRNGETFIYYCASQVRHTKWDYQRYLDQYQGDMRHECSVMLARMPRDRWMYAEAGESGGYVTHKPWGPPHEVFVNADARGGSIRCELVTPYGQVVPGYGLEDCIPVTGNGSRQAVRWKNGGHPWSQAARYPGGILTRFHLQNARLYSYTLTLPDPDGSLERDKANARWCDFIRHRNDQWGARSNDPAGGVPPHSSSSSISLFEQEQHSKP